MSDEPQNQQPFYFDEFFGGDAGVEVLLPIRGRVVPIRIKRGLTLKEKAAAEAVAVHRSVDPATGQIKIDRIDEGKAAEEVAFRMILSWPFTYRSGEPVPITRENVANLLGMDKLVLLARKLEDEGEQALAPFVAPSAEASSPAQPSTSVSPQEASPSA